MVHPLEQVSQNDSAWKTSPLGTSNTTLGAVGCYISSFSVLATYYGHKITPPELNQLFIDKGLFAQGNLISSDDDLEKVFPDVKYTMSLYFPNTPPTPANLGVLRDLMSDPTNTVIICIDLHNGSVHFTPVIDCDGTTVTIMNVWDGKVRNFKDVYGDPATNIIRFVVYKGTPTVQEATQQEIIDELRKQRDHNNNLTVALLDRLDLHPTDTDPVDTQVARAGDAIDIMKNKITILQARLDLLDPPPPVSSDTTKVTGGNKTGKKGTGKKAVISDSIVSVEKVALKQGIYSLLQRLGVLV